MWRFPNLPWWCCSMCCSYSPRSVVLVAKTYPGHLTSMKGRRQSGHRPQHHLCKMREWVSRAPGRRAGIPAFEARHVVPRISGRLAESPRLMLESGLGARIRAGRDWALRPAELGRPCRSTMHEASSYLDGGARRRLLACLAWYRALLGLAWLGLAWPRMRTRRAGATPCGPCLHGPGCHPSTLG